MDKTNSEIINEINKLIKIMKGDKNKNKDLALILIYIKGKVD